MFHLAAETSLFQCSKRYFFLFQLLCVHWPLPMLRPCGLFRLLNRFLFCQKRQKQKQKKKTTTTTTKNIAKSIQWFHLHILHIKSTYIVVVGVIRHACLQKGFEMLRKCTILFHRFYKIRTCFKFQAKEVPIQRGPNWRILAQQVFKITVLSPGVLLYFINGLSFI